jgi:hypothetical protein
MSLKRHRRLPVVAALALAGCDHGKAAMALE